MVRIAQNPPRRMVSTPSPAPDADALPQRWRRLRRVANVALGVVLAVYAVLLAAWLLLHWAILPQLDRWRPEIERQASRALGAPVQIGRLSVTSGSWVPAIDVHDLRLFDPQGREALRLARVQAALDPQSLLTLSLRLQQVLIDGARLELRRDAAGRLHIAGFAWDAAAPDGDPRLRDWVLAQPEFVIRDSRVVWVDETRDGAPLELSDVDFVLRNGIRRHALRLDATPPPQWGDRLSLRGRFTQPLLAPRSDFKRWSGTLYAEVPRADVAELRRHVDLPFELREGDGALRAWAEFDSGQSRRLTLDLALRSVSLRLADELERLELQQVQGRIEAERDLDGVKLAVRRFGFMTGDGLGWPAADLQFTWQQAQDLQQWPPSTAPVTGGEFQADRLDLDVIARTTARLPVGHALRRLLHSVAPQGSVEGLKGRWTGPIDAPATYQVSASLSGLNLAAGDAGTEAGRPGLRNGRLQFDANERGGEARLALKGGALIFPGVWQQPQVDFDSLEAKLDWRIQPGPAGALPAVTVDLRQARFTNADAQGEVDARWATGRGEGFGRGGRFPGTIELSGRLQRARVERIARYLPLDLPAVARDYVTHALKGGQVDEASVRLRGDLWDFPFVDARAGEFRVSARARDLTLAYIPSTPATAGAPAWVSPWPAFTQVSGEVEFDRSAMRLRGVRASLWGYELRELNGGIADLGAADPVLTLDGQGQGPAGDLLRYVRSTPLAEWLGPQLASAAASGGSELKLALVLPLHHPERSTARGSVQLPGNELRWRADLPPLLNARGRIDFTQQDFQLRGASARLLGGDVDLDGGLGADGTLRLNAQGTATADALRAAPGLGLASRLAAQMRGQAAYRAGLVVRRGVPEFTLSSNLAGLQLDFPAPLAKPAAASWPLNFQVAPAGDGGRAREQWQLELADVLKLRLQFDPGAPGAPLVRGSVAVGDVLPALPAASLTATLRLGAVDVDAWEALLDRLAEPAGAGSDAAPLPATIVLRAAELRSGRRRVSQVVANLQRQSGPTDTLWRADVQAEQLEGRIEWRQASGAGQPARVMARLQRLRLPPADVAGVEELLAQPPASVPALDIVVDDFELRGKKLGRLQVQAVNRPLLPGRGGAREWQLETLSLDVPEARLEAKGRWLAAGSRRMQLDFKLDLSDSGALLARLGAGAVLRGGKGSLQGQLSWAGSPLAFDAASLDGRVALALEAGQILQADPGGARLLGVFSLQALPRRLTLDFRDLFQEGFAFDTVSGDFQVVRGSARTSNLRLRGVQATVLVQGGADLLHETQDLQVLIVPNLDASAAALATMAINPAIGLGTLFAQWALREPLMAANTREYRVTGPWAEPNVQRVPRTAASPAPAIEPLLPVPAARPASAPAAVAEKGPAG